MRLYFALLITTGLVLNKIPAVASNFYVPSKVNDSLSITKNAQPATLPEVMAHIPNSGKWKLTWSDEFNYNGLPDSTKMEL